MRLLPERPNLDHLRRQAKELLRATRAGEPAATRRIRAVSKNPTLAAAQLALARDYGFASWARLTAEVQRRRAPRTMVDPKAQPVMRTWEKMRHWMETLLEKRTGQTVDAWKQRLARHRFADEAALRRWLTKNGVTGYSQTLLVWERFGYPRFMTAGIDDLIGRQYADRPQLRPILDAVLAALPTVGSVVTVQARKTYISLVTERRTFAVVQATTKNRVDLGLRLEGARPGRRLLSGKGVGNGSMSVKLPLTSTADLDGEALGWLTRAYEENS